jgi:hypothetical protein
MMVLVRLHKNAKALFSAKIMFSLFLFSGICALYAGEGVLPYKEMLYCEKRQALYDQSSLITGSKFMSASREKQEQMLVKHLRDAKSWGLLSLAGKAVTTMAFYGGIPAVIFYKLLKGRDIGGAMGVTMAMQPLGSILGEFYKKVDAQGTFLATMVMEEFISRVVSGEKPLLPAEKIELDYIKRKPFLDAQFTQLIEDSLIGFFCHSAWIDGSQRGGITSVDGIRTALALPTDIKKVIYDEALIDATLSGYSPEIKDALKLFCVRHIASGQTSLPRKAPIYFYGPHGVGKTYAVKLIANALQLPCATIQLRGTLESLIGDAYTPGQLLEALTTAKYEGRGAKNMILFIDEADKIINFNANAAVAPELQAIRSFLLNLFDAETKSFYSPYLKIDVDISHVGIILAGNAPIEYAPMANRFRLVEFPKFTVEEKTHLMETALLDKALAPYAQSQGSVFSIAKQDLAPEDYAAFHTIIEHDKDEGLRSLLAKLEDYLANMASCKTTHKDNLSWARKMLNWVSPMHRYETERAYRTCVHDLNQVQVLAEKPAPVPVAETPVPAAKTTTESTGSVQEISLEDLLLLQNFLKNATLATDHGSAN